MPLRKIAEISVGFGDALIKNLNHFLVSNKLHEAELARQTGIPQPTLHKILTGKTTDPRISTIQILANYFGVTIDALYGDVLLKNTVNASKGRSVPIISWVDAIHAKEAIKKISFANWESWIFIEDNYSDALFALKSKSSTESRFPKGTIFVVDLKATPQDGDYVVVYYSQAKECSLREFSSDGVNEMLLPLKTHIVPDKFTRDIHLVGVLVESRFLYA